jgi:hypothetical protein
MQGWSTAPLFQAALRKGTKCVAPGSFDGRHAGQQMGAGAQERCPDRLHQRAPDQQRQAGSVRCKAAQSTCDNHANNSNTGCFVMLWRVFAYCAISVDPSHVQ